MEAISISNEQSLKSGIKDLVIAAMSAGAHGIAQLKNCVLRDDENNKIDFEIAVTVKKVQDMDGNVVIINELNIADKRAQFTKDINKLISGDYVLVAKKDLDK